MGAFHVTQKLSNVCQRDQEKKNILEVQNIKD